MTGAVRHASSVTVHLQLRDHVLALTVFPVHRLVHCVMPMAQFFEQQLTDLEVLRVEKSHQQVPNLQTLAQVSVQRHYASLGRLLWELALRGSRDELLPEIAGDAHAQRPVPAGRPDGQPHAPGRHQRRLVQRQPLAAAPALPNPAGARALHSSADSPRPIAD